MATARDDLYYRDWYRWAREQADGLRKLADERMNTDLELELIAEEMEELALSHRAAFRSQVRRAIEHLLKLEYSPSVMPRRMWRISVRDARIKMRDYLTATLENETRATLAEIYEDARELAADAMRAYDEHEAAAALPPSCAYTFEQILDRSWLPPSRAGVAEE
jgi:Domain of unknown function DUF29